MKIAACLGVLSAAGYVALAPAGAPAHEAPSPRTGARYRHEPVHVSPGHRAFTSAEASPSGGRSVAPPVQTTDPDLLL